MVNSLWMQPVSLGDIALSNRVVMAPLTRMRASEGGVPSPLANLYYKQRATAGLIITEATQISPLGKGYPATPGIYTEEQMIEWKKIVQAVHQEGSKIVLQLWHVGRISHSSLHPQEGLPWAPSAIAPTGQTMNASWAFVPYETPKEMTLDDIQTLISQYRQSAQLAKEAGFDGVEIHSANGYLLDQFLQDGSNKRNDRYGGSYENRARLLLEIIDAVCNVYPSSRVGVRLSPFGTFNDMKDSNPVDLFNTVISLLNDKNLSYLHLIEPRSSASGANDKINIEAPLTTPMFKSKFKGKIISAGGYTKELGEKALFEGEADAIAFGRLFISNPDLVERLVHGYELNKYDRSTFYGGGEKGYIDYPKHQG